MEHTGKTPNRLIHESSPYLLQHAHNPVDWYPWGEEAFRRARELDRPVFLSIGYSTCHWCHVMARESFEDAETAGLINRWFVPVKVDREERPDVDSVYMAVCQAFTGGGGWPASIFMTPDRRPFFAGTYFPPTSRGGLPGLRELLGAIHEGWDGDREALLRASDGIISSLRDAAPSGGRAGAALLRAAAGEYKRGYDRLYGGFGPAPKFPAAHNLMLLMTLYEKQGDGAALDMAVSTLRQMYRGGLFDHVGGGFCRYATDRQFLIPHFEKMLYDNALLIMALCRAHRLTKKPPFLRAAERTADWALRELAAPGGGFYSAQDADSQGEEGKYYLFRPRELTELLGAEAGARFNRHFGISGSWHMHGGCIPNLLGTEEPFDAEDALLPAVYACRRGRMELRTDDKCLTVWNAMMAAALCHLYRTDGRREYLDAAAGALDFIDANLRQGERLSVSFRAGKRSGAGFLDDYAWYSLAQLALYEAGGGEMRLREARLFCGRAMEEFADGERGGFFMSGAGNERLILRPKETYDGALPSGNSVMAWVLVRLAALTGEARFETAARRQLDFMAGPAREHPSGHAMFLMALSDYLDPPERITAVAAPGDAPDAIALRVPPETVLSLPERPTEAYPLKDGRTTFYVCKNHACLPPSNEL